MSAAAGLVSRWSRGSIRVFVALVLAASNSKAQVVPPPPPAQDSVTVVPGEVY